MGSTTVQSSQVSDAPWHSLTSTITDWELERFSAVIAGQLQAGAARTDEGFCWEVDCAALHTGHS